MEGLLLAEALRPLLARLPSERLSWRFPDANTFVLPLGEVALWLYLRPPNPLFSVQKGFPSHSGSNSAFQDLLAARAVGPLQKAEQAKLDRVVAFYFAASEGFVNMPPVKLVAELTGRNSNLILLNEEGVILGAWREVGRGINRFREVRPGLPYQGPPPYDKLDIRTASDEALIEVLKGTRLKDLRTQLDGFGPTLTGAAAHRLGLSPSTRLEDDALARALPVLRELGERPGAVLAALGEVPGLESLREDEARTEHLRVVKEALEKERRKLQRRLDDLTKAEEAAAEADGLRQRGDLLMAHAYALKEKVASVTLTDFDGQEVTLQLDPKLSAIDNAQALYARARKREQALEQVRARAPKLEQALKEVERTLASLAKLPPQELERLHKKLLPDEAQARRQAGITFTSPQGFKVRVGRNAKENEALFRAAKSADLWLHVQGYHGSHVIVQAQNREVPFETVLFAAELAAAHSQAGESDNVPVDYTLRKNVWKPKGTPAGAVHYSQQKTVYVTPKKHRDEEATLLTEP